MLSRRQLFAAAAGAATVRAEGAARVIAIGDVHGDLDGLIDVLTMAGVVDGRQRWSGGSARVVQLGNMVDRGARVPQAMELMMRLDAEARPARGGVTCLTGKHEALRMRGELGAVAPGELEFFKSRNSEEEREKLFQRELARMQARGDVRRREDLAIGYRQRWEKQHPLGEGELIRAFSPSGRFGKWMLGQSAALRVGDSLFVHGGISSKYAEWSEYRLNERVREELKTPPPAGAENSITLDPLGPLLWRGLAREEESVLAPLMERVLQRHGVKRIVASKPPDADPAPAARLGGRVILVDSGLAQPGGSRRACLVVEDGGAFLLDGGQRTQVR